MKTLIVIPARYGSKRFPGKPLAELAGKPILRRVWEIAQSACAARPGCRAVIATEEPGPDGSGSGRILDYCHANDMEVLVTPSSCRSGSDRAWAAVSAMAEKPDVVINLQGDNPVCPPDFLLKLTDAFTEHPETQVATPFTRLSWEALDRLRESKKSSPFSGTTVIVGSDGNARWFSKNIIPGIRGEEKLRALPGPSPVCRHVGLYAYRLAALAYFYCGSAGTYEQLEQLEQLRFLENNIPVRMVEVSYPAGYDRITSGIDTPEDLARAEKVISEAGELLK